MNPLDWPRDRDSLPIQPRVDPARLPPQKSTEEEGVRAGLAEREHLPLFEMRSPLYQTTTLEKDERVVRRGNRSCFLLTVGLPIN